MNPEIDNASRDSVVPSQTQETIALRLRAAQDSEGSPKPFEQDVVHGIDFDTSTEYE